MKRILLSVLGIGLVACSPTIQTLTLGGTCSPPVYPDVSLDGWLLSLTDLKGQNGASLGKTQGEAFSTKLDKRFTSGLYVLSVRHPQKGTMFSVAFPLAEKKDLALSTTSTLAAMGLMFAARIGDDSLSKLSLSRLEAMIPQGLKNRFERAYDDSLSGNATAPADNAELARDTYWTLRKTLERTPE